jgi:hypothetical protein
MSLKTVLAASIAAAAFAGLATAQDWSLAPNFGTTSLEIGFMPDPYQVPVIAGGPIDASAFGCAGSISNAPDFRLHWEGTGLTIGATSAEDTTLVVNGPDGEWYCIDDVNGFDPAIRFQDGGQYDIWIGVYSGGTANATLYFTEF